MAQALRIAVIVGRDEEAAALIARGLPPQSGLSLVFSMPSTRTLTKRLRSVAAVPVVDVHRSMRIQPDHIYVLPAERESTLHLSWIAIDAPARRASRDRLLRSLADSFGEDGAAVLLADRGSDGVLGAKRVKEAGGITICQIGAGEEVSELARAASANAIVDLAVPAAEIGSRLFSLIGGPDTLELDDATVEDILALLRKRTKLDFHAFKRDVLAARLRRRMHICQTPSLAGYHKLLHDEPTEVNLLARELLIRVADFFRGPADFDVLAREAMPRVFRGKGAQQSVRVWVPGCETGEEAYSIGMLLHEYAGYLREMPRLHVLATDLDEEALREARAGIYPEAITADVSEQRLRRFFTHEHDHYRVTSELRDITVFSTEAMPLTPPTSRLDFVCCRGVLSSLTDEAQLRALEIFHAALRPGGLLWLGESEHASGALFTPLDAKHNLYERRATPQAQVPALTDAGASESVDALHHRLIDHYGMASVLVDEALDVLHASARASELLTSIPNALTRQLLHLVHPGLGPGLRSAIHAAKEDARRIVTRNVRFEDQGSVRCVEVRVRTIEGTATSRPAFLVMLDERDEDTQIPSGRLEPLLDELEQELRRTRDELRVTADQYVKALRATYAGALVLDRQLAIAQCSGRIQQLLHIAEPDIGRPLAELRHRFDANLAQLAKQVLDSGSPKERALRDTDHRHYHVRIEPQQADVGVPAGVVLTFVDVTELHTSEDTMSSALRSADVAVIAHDANADITWGYVHGETKSSASELFTEDSADRYTATVHGVFTTGTTGHVDVELTIGGVPAVYEFQIAPIVEDATVTGVTSIGVPRRLQ